MGSFGVTGWHDIAKVPGPGVTVGRSGASYGVVARTIQDYWPLNTCLYVDDFHGNDPNWVYFLLSQLDFKSYNSGSAQPSLNRNYIKHIRLSVPPLEEQERIAGVLGAFDDLIETNRGLIADLENLIHALFVEEQFDALPSPASAVSLGDLLIVNPKIAKPKGSAPYIDMAMLPTSSALLGSPLERTASGGAKFANGDTLLARITPCLENGKTAYVTNLPEGSVAVGSTEFIVMRGVGDLSGIWSYALARSPRFRGFAIQQLGDGTSGRQRLSADAVSGYLVTRPSTQALTRFRQRTEPLVEAMTALHSEGLDLSEKRDELLPLLMSGKVRVRDVESELS